MTTHQKWLGKMVLLMVLLLSEESDVRESQSSKVNWVRSSYARQPKNTAPLLCRRRGRRLDSASNFRIARQAPHSTAAPKHNLFLFRLETSGGQPLKPFQCALALEVKLATLDLPVQTHLDGCHKFRDGGKRGSTETKKLSAKLGKRKRKQRRKALIMRKNPEAQTDRIDA